jgi:hypothetical protein
MPIFFAFLFSLLFVVSASFVLGFDERLG